MKKEMYNLWIGILIVCLIVLITALALLENNPSTELTLEEKEIQKFSECINRTQLQLYGRTNSQISSAQKEELGTLFDLIPFVDCLNEREKCGGILLVPAWEFNGQIYYGSFSKEVLIKLLECE